MNPPEKKSVHTDVMAVIRTGEVHMRPRWHFVLFSALSITGASLVFLTLLYVASLGIFFLRDSGTWFTPSFGLRGWLSLARDLPWLLILFLLIFIVILELLVRHFSFVYKKPLLASVLGIVALIFAGGFLITQTPLHRSLMLSVQRGELPLAIGMMYSAPLRGQLPDDVYHGQIVGITKDGLVIVDEDGAGTTSVFITPQTRLPYGENFATGTRVVVVGDESATGTIRAFGIREIDEYPEQ